MSSITRICLFIGLIPLFIPNAQAKDWSDTPAGYKPDVALLVDYVDTNEGMWGLTLASRHFDPDYSNWGYYLGYVKGNKTHIAVPEPAESYMKEYMWRFGLSYSLSQDLSLYAGATAYTYETFYTNNIVHPIEGGEPVWESSRERDWGAEFGVRYQLFKGFVIGAGFDTQTESAIFSVGISL